MSHYDKDLLDRIKTREELEKRGYTRKTCKQCKGSGRITWDDDPCGSSDCCTCDSRGYTWIAPLTR